MCETSYSSLQNKSLASKWGDQHNWVVGEKWNFGAKKKKMQLYFPNLLKFRSALVTSFSGNVKGSDVIHGTDLSRGPQWEADGSNLTNALPPRGIWGIVLDMCLGKWIYKLCNLALAKLIPLKWKNGFNRLL